MGIDKHINKTSSDHRSAKSRQSQRDAQKVHTDLAAFYDVDGTLIDANVLHPYAYYAASAPSLSGKVGRLLKMGASLPLYAWADRQGRKYFNDLFYQNYKGLSEDRLYVIGQEIFERMLKGRIFADMQTLIRQSKSEGMRQVLITGNLDTIIAPLAEYLGVDDWVANRLEFDSPGIATGNLIPPVLAGPEKSTWIHTYARQHKLDLQRCHAYADSASDIPLLCAVGYPTAVNPDAQLKATADAHNWPIIWAK